MCVVFLLESLVLLINYKSTENIYFRKFDLILFRSFVNLFK